MGVIMEIIGYGEDALTLWAIKNKLHAILQELNDNSDVSRCKVFFRPSFGRRGGEKSAQFGEFDFIILSKERIYLGESKWDGSSENKNGILELRDEQKFRHEVMKFYICQWFKGDFPDWSSFVRKVGKTTKHMGVEKPLAPVGSLLASNLQTLLETIKSHFSSLPEIRNILLYLHKGKSSNPISRVSKDFDLVKIDYSQDSVDNFIRIVI
jgi:hypothetical protein